MTSYGILSTYRPTAWCWSTGGRNLNQGAESALALISTLQHGRRYRAENR